MAQLDAILSHIRPGHPDRLYLAAGHPPCLRREGQATAVPGAEAVQTDEELRELLGEVLGADHFSEFERRKHLTASYCLRGEQRLRVSVYELMSGIAASIVGIPFWSRPMEELGLPQQLTEVLKLSKGLVLIAGAYGTGKSTTLAALVHALNESAAGLIVCIEEPLTFMHRSKSCLVVQREVGVDTPRVETAVGAALRQGADVVALDAPLSREGFSAALRAAEAGLLVVMTLPAPGSAQAIERCVGHFTAAEQPRVRARLGHVLRAIIVQRRGAQANGAQAPFEVETLLFGRRGGAADTPLR